MNRFYFNITNKCNVSCPFCCMYSSPKKTTYLSFNKFKEIIDSKTEKYELQLEGGEPFLHPYIFLFLEYAYSTGRCTKIIISTNGILLDKHITRLVEFHTESNIPMVIKPSINFHLANLNPHIYKKSRDLVCSTEFINGFDVLFNVRIEKNDTQIIEKLIEFKIVDKSNIFEFQRYGRYSDKEEYIVPFIRQNIDDWFIYAADGTCFGKDLVARSLYEKDLV